MIDKHEIGSESIEILIKDLSIEDAILRYVSEISEESRIELLLLDKISRVNFNNAIVNNDQKYIYWSINKDEQTSPYDLVIFIVKDIFSYLNLEYDDFKSDIYTASDRKYEIKKGVINTNSLSSQSVMDELNLFLDNISGTSLEDNPEINTIKKTTQEEINKLREKEKKLKLFISKKSDSVADSIDKKITSFEDELGKDKENTEKKILRKVQNENLSNIKKEEKEKVAYENLKNKASEERILKNSIANKLIINLHTNAILKYGNEINSVNSEIKRSISKALLIEEETIKNETIASIKKLAKEKITSIESRRDSFIKSERVKIIHDQSIMTKSEKELSSLISNNEEMIKNEINSINIEIRKIVDEYNIYLPVVRDSLDGYDNKTLKKWRDLYSLAKLKVSIINEQNKVDIAKKSAFNNYNSVIDGLSNDSDYSKKEEKVKEYLSEEKRKIKLEKKVANIDKKNSQKAAKNDIKRKKSEFKVEENSDDNVVSRNNKQSTLEKIDASHSKKIEKIESKKAAKENNKKLKEEAKLKKEDNKREIKDLKNSLKEKSKFQTIEGNLNNEIKNNNLKKDVKEFKKVVDDIKDIEKKDKSNNDVKILKEQNDDIMMTIDLSIDDIINNDKEAIKRTNRKKQEIKEELPTIEFDYESIIESRKKESDKSLESDDNKNIVNDSNEQNIEKSTPKNKKDDKEEIDMLIEPQDLNSEMFDVVNTESRKFMRDNYYFDYDYDSGKDLTLSQKKKKFKELILKQNDETKLYKLVTVDKKELKTLEIIHKLEREEFKKGNAEFIRLVDLSKIDVGDKTGDIRRYFEENKRIIESNYGPIDEIETAPTRELNKYTKEDLNKSEKRSARKAASSKEIRRASKNYSPDISIVFGKDFNLKNKNKKKAANNQELISKKLLDENKNPHINWNKIKKEEKNNANNNIDLNLSKSDKDQKKESFATNILDKSILEREKITRPKVNKSKKNAFVSGNENKPQDIVSEAKAKSKTIEKQKEEYEKDLRKKEKLMNKKILKNESKTESKKEDYSKKDLEKSINTIKKIRDKSSALNLIASKNLYKMDRASEENKIPIEQKVNLKEIIREGSKIEREGINKKIEKSFTERVNDFSITSHKKKILRKNLVEDNSVFVGINNRKYKNPNDPVDIINKREKALLQKQAKETKRLKEGHTVPQAKSYFKLNELHELKSKNVSAVKRQERAEGIFGKRVNDSKNHGYYDKKHRK